MRTSSIRFKPNQMCASVCMLRSQKFVHLQFSEITHSYVYHIQQGYTQRAMNLDYFHHTESE